MTDCGSSQDVSILTQKTKQKIKKKEKNKTTTKNFKKGKY